eukprot:scaffold74202_cov33-Tisochrysis_lutea.AAC.1
MVRTWPNLHVTASAVVSKGQHTPEGGRCVLWAFCLRCQALRAVTWRPAHDATALPVKYQQDTI